MDYEALKLQWLNMAVGGIRLNKGEIAVVKYGCRME
jgi:hypothetical protein